MKKSHTVGHILYVLLYILLIALSIAFYNHVNLEMLLYLGWLTLAIGIVFLICSSRSRKKAVENFIVENGMYAFVRHPEFLSHAIIIIALILISQHWITLAIGLALIIFLYIAAIEEERRNIEKFGKAYEDYMDRVLRMNFIVGIIKQMQNRKYVKKSK